LNHFEDIGCEYRCSDEKFESVDALLALVWSGKTKEVVDDE
jgi:hypothetical protein